MYSKLNLKIHGQNSTNDLTLLENNLTAYSGIKKVHLSTVGESTTVNIEFDANVISKQQIFDLIKISGDFQAKELSPEEMENKQLIVKEEKSVPSQEPCACPTSRVSALTTSNIYLLLGILTGFSIMSLILNIVFGYLLIKPIKLQANSDSTTAIQAAATQPSQPPAEAATAPTVQTFNITKNDHVRGDFNAPITLVEYSDFECPFCAKHDPTLKKLLSEYPSSIRLVYKHFPLGFHPNAQKAAEAAECADEQNNFWEFHDKLFANQSSGYSLDNFKQWAKDLELNTKQFNNCLDSGKYTKKVLADAADGQSRGVNGTPATFVNGQLVSGAVPYESFKTVIDQILNN